MNGRLQRLSAAVRLLALLAPLGPGLVACGGGTSVSSNTTPSPSPAAAPAPASSTAASPQMPAFGVYVGTVSRSGQSTPDPLYAAVVPAVAPLSAMVYGVEMLPSASNSGLALTSVDAAAASLASNGELQLSSITADEAGNLRSGTATLSDASLNAFSNTVNLAAFLVQGSSPQVVLPAATLTWHLTSLSALASIAPGTWSGTWVDGNNLNSAASVTLNNQTLSFISGACSSWSGTGSTSTTLNSVNGLSNAWAVTLYFQPNSACLRSVDNPLTAPLNGVVFAYNDNLGLAHLQLMAVNSAGSGISFNGTQ